VLGHLPVTASCTNLVLKNQFPELNGHILTFFNKFYCLESHTEHRRRCSKPHIQQSVRQEGEGGFLC
jgi:hypothetical protein